MKRTLARLCALFLLPLWGFAAEPHAVVFMYHRFGEDRYPSTSIRLEQFDAQLRYLAEHDYHVWPLGRVIRHLQAREPLPDRTVALTVDDAFASVYKEAYPRLKARGWPFTVFVSTNPVDRGLTGYMSWEQMREMQANGVRFANHSADHGHLIVRRPGEREAAWQQRVRADILRAQQRLEGELGAQTNSAPRLFAYPYGEYDTALAALVHSLGFTALGQQSGAIGPDSDPRVLPRYPMSEAFAGIDGFAAKAASLPLNLAEITPWDPVVTGPNPPPMSAVLADPDIEPGRVACYASRQGHIEVRWPHPGRRRFTVVAPAPLPTGRARYNCTVPAGGGRYRWYSHLWIIPPVGTGPGD
jgi:biofilm PGA synthesis lipoprotein PgaB